MELVWPLFAGLGFILMVIRKILFAWWLDPLLQRKANRALWDDVQTNFYFLTSAGHLAKERPAHIHPFDYASIRIIFDNLCFCFTRGRGELNISLSPSRAPEDSHHLDWVVAALASRDATELEPMGSLDEVAQVIRPRLDALNRAFSESEYPEFRKKLSEEKKSERIRTRQLEWELNKAVYGRGTTKP
ncbi:MAG TPA: hypothetical protein VJX30_05900 [Terriglobales bacterium]|jgi:hypothetical protein|nr:hypothetical protein [Terriglobales bacterium]